MSAEKFVVWLKDEGRWVEQGDGPLTRKTAERIAHDYRHICPAKVLPVGADPYVKLRKLYV